MNTSTKIQTSSASKAVDAPPAKRAQPKSARRRSRESALQGLYQWLVTGDEVAIIDAHVRELEDFNKVDREHFDLLLYGSELVAAVGQQHGTTLVTAQYLVKRHLAGFQGADKALQLLQSLFVAGGGR